MPLPKHSVLDHFEDPIVISSSMGSIAHNAIVTSGATMTNTLNVRFAVFTLVCQWATVANIEGKPIHLLLQPKSIDGFDQIAPTTAFRRIVVASFVAPPATANTDALCLMGNRLAQLPNYTLAQAYQPYLHNFTNQTISAGGTLRWRPVSIHPTLT